MASVAQLQRGALFADRFRVERLVGRGGMGAVYEVVEEATGQRFALKVLAPQLVSDAKHRERFERETTIANGIASERVVKVLEAGIDELSETPWLTMELLRGESLQTFVRTHGKLDPARALTVLGQVGEALAAAHVAGVIHRDLKPDNVFIVRDAGTAIDVKVLDFGIAKLASDARTRSTGAMGSPLWMAPEEAQKARLTAAADVWSLGLLTFFVLTGHLLWRASDGESNVAQALKEVLLEPLPQPDARAKDFGVTLPDGFSDWFAGCVNRDPSLRFQNAADALAALRPILERDPVTTRIAAPPSSRSLPSAPVSVPLPEGAPAPEAKRLTVSWLVGVAGLGLATIFMIVAGTMLGRAINGDGDGLAPSASPSASASVAPSASASALAPPASAIADVAPEDAGDPIFSAVEACLAASDLACARSALEPSVFGKTAELYHAQLLYDLCELQHDATCRATIAKLYSKVDTSPRRERTIRAPEEDSVTAAANGDASVFDEALSLSVSDPKRAHALLEPRVQAGKATNSEVALLKTICGLQKDTDCVRMIDKRYPAQAKH